MAWVRGRVQVHMQWRYGGVAMVCRAPTFTDPAPIVPSFSVADCCLDPSPIVHGA